MLIGSLSAGGEILNEKRSQGKKLPGELFGKKLHREKSARN